MDPVPRLAILSAFGLEMEKLYYHTEISTLYILNGHTVWTGRLAGHNILLTTTGIGLNNAALTTRVILEKFNITGIIVTGIAGGVNPALAIGDVVVPERWAEYQAYSPSDYRAKEFSNDQVVWLPADPSFLESARQIAPSVKLDPCTPVKCLLKQPGVSVAGRGASGMVIVMDGEFRQHLRHSLAADIVDMESAAAGRIAFNHNVPFIAFRSLSDLADGQHGVFELLTNSLLAANNSAEMTLKFLEY